MAEPVTIRVEPVLAQCEQCSRWMHDSRITPQYHFGLVQRCCADCHAYLNSDEEWEESRA